LQGRLFPSIRSTVPSAKTTTIFLKSAGTDSCEKICRQILTGGNRFALSMTIHAPVPDFTVERGPAFADSH
jgi:hypothetical protein